jgi:hypothetical protein
MSSLLESDQKVYPLEGERSRGNALAAAIMDHLDEQAVISLDMLVCLMPQYTWNEIFHCVDRLTRCNRIVLRRHRFEYTLFSPDFLA